MRIDSGWHKIKRQVGKKEPITESKWTSASNEETTEHETFDELQPRKEWNYYLSQVGKKRNAPIPKTERIARVGMRIKPEN